MTAIERTAYPRFKTQITQQELEQVYRPTIAEQAFVLTTAKGNAVRLRLMVLLKTCQRLGYFVSFNAVPRRIVDYIRAQMSIDQTVVLAVNRSKIKLTRLYHAVRVYMGVKSYQQDGEAVAVAAIHKALDSKDNPADLINEVIEELIRQNFILPGFSTLDRLVSRHRTHYHQHLFMQVFERLTDVEKQQLDRLPLLSDSTGSTDFSVLKQPPGAPRLTELHALTDRLMWLEGLLDSQRLLQGISPTRIKHFAGEARVLETGDLLDCEPPKRYLLLLCLLQRAQTLTRDHLVETFIKRIQHFHKRAEEALQILREQLRDLTEVMVDMIGKISQSAQVNLDDQRFGQEVRQLLQLNGGPEVLAERAELLAAYHDNNYLLLLPRFYHSHRAVLFRMLAVLHIEATAPHNSFWAALQFMRGLERVKDEWIPLTIALNFTSRKWRNLLIKHDEQGDWLHRQQFELCVFSHLALGLKAGDLCVAHAEAFADIRAQLLSWEACQPLLLEHCQALHLPTSAQSFVGELRQRLHQRAAQVDADYPDNRSLTFTHTGQVTLARDKRLPLPEGCEALKREISRRMPQRSVLEILANVQHWTNFTRHFSPPSGSDPKIADSATRYLLTVFGYGCNLGPTQTAKHTLLNISARMISLLNRQHSTSEKIDAALRDIIHYYRRLDLPGYWGTGTAAAADGTQFDLYRNNLLAERHVRYGGYGGIAYNHIADSYIALFSHFIACGVWEAVYIIDGLLKNTSDLQPNTLHADTHGQSEAVFGLTYPLGIQLMPRIRNWKQLIFYKPSKAVTYQHLEPLFSDSINWKRIEVYWQDLMTVVLSIRVGKLLPSTLLRKLGTYSRQNRIYQAFRELGRVIRTLFLLDYISDEALRRRVQQMTSKMESFNGFSKWLFFGGDGVIAENDPIEQEKRIKYNHLVANAVILQNAADMTQILRDLVREGFTVTREMLAHLSPYMTDHIRRFGDYVLDLNTVPPPLALDTPLL
jgi:TnpA family transposase